MAPRTPLIRLGLFACGLILGSVCLSATSFAQQSCGEDIKRMTEKREVELKRVNTLVASYKGKPIDPAQFCSQSAGLNTAETALIAYMEKNKDWCGVPDEIINGLKANHVKSLAFTAKACSVAAQMKKQQAAGGGNGAPQAPALPTGPL